MIEFRIGAGRYAFAVGVVESVGIARPDLPHLGTLLGHAGSGQTTGSRAFRLERGVEVNVDEPIELYEISADEIVPSPLRRSALPGLLGFAQRAGELIVLLDPATLLAGAERG